MPGSFLPDFKDLKDFKVLKVGRRERKLTTDL
jgi:hypothetical protein